MYYSGLRVPQLFPVGFKPVVRLQRDSLVLIQIVWPSTNGQQPGVELSILTRKQKKCFYCILYTHQPGHKSTSVISWDQFCHRLETIHEFQLPPSNFPPTLLKVTATLSENKRRLCDFDHNSKTVEGKKESQFHTPSFVCTWSLYEPLRY